MSGPSDQLQTLFLRSQLGLDQNYLAHSLLIAVRSKNKLVTLEAKSKVSCSWVFNTTKKGRKVFTMLPEVVLRIQKTSLRLMLMLKIPVLYKLVLEFLGL